MMKREGEARRAEGWAMASNARVAHFYTSGDRSLCGKWVLFLRTAGKHKTFEGPKCVNCTRKLAQRNHPKGRK